MTNRADFAALKELFMHFTTLRSTWLPACGLAMATIVLATGGCGGGKPASSESSSFEVAEDSKPAGETETVESAGELDGAMETETAEVAPSKGVASAETEIDERSGAPRQGGSETGKSGETGLYKTPKGPPTVQLEFIKRMLNTPLVGSSAKSKKLDYEDRMGVVLASCGLVLQNQSATVEQRQTAIRTKFDVLSQMAVELESNDYAQQAMAFAAQLQTSEKGTIEKTMGVQYGVQLLPQQFGLLTSPTESDVKKLVEGYSSYLAEGPLPPMYYPGLAIVRLLNERGFREMGIDVLEQMVAAFTAAKELPEVDKYVSELNGQLRLLTLDLPGKLRATVLDEAAFADLDGAFDELLKDEAGESKWLQFMHEIGVALERSGKVDSASKVYERLAKMNESAKEEKAAQAVKQVLEHAAARKKLLGQPLDFSATRADKSEFKLSSLVGKKVLVLFWSATVQAEFNALEFENIQQVLMSHPGAFEVVLCNLDDEPSVFEEFSKLQSTEWANASVAAPDTSKPGFSSDLEKQIGIDQPPYALMLDKEGKVEAVFAQGPRLQAIAATSAESDASPTTEEKKPAEVEKAAEPAEAREAVKSPVAEEPALEKPASEKSPESPKGSP